MKDNILHNEKELLIGAAAGDEQAFATIYQHFHQRAFLFARKFVTEQDAKDITSEAFIKIWNKRTELDNIQSISGLLFSMVRNRCIDLVRHQVMKDQKQEEIINLLESSEENDLDIEQVKAELVRKIYDEVEKLPARTKEIFLLSFQQGLRPALIAQRLQLNVQTVRNQKLTAIKLLQEALGQRANLLYLLILFSADSFNS